MPTMKLTTPHHKSSQSLLSFKLKDYKASKPSEKLGRLLVVLVDGPESLALRQAARRLGIPFAVAKAQLKTYRRVIESEKKQSLKCSIVIEKVGSTSVLSEQSSNNLEIQSDVPLIKPIFENENDLRNLELQTDGTSTISSSPIAPCKEGVSRLKLPATRHSLFRSKSDESSARCGDIFPNTQMAEKNTISRSKSFQYPENPLVVVESACNKIHRPEPIRQNIPIQSTPQYLVRPTPRSEERIAMYDRSGSTSSVNEENCTPLPQNISEKSERQEKNFSLQIKEVESAIANYLDLNSLKIPEKIAPLPNQDILKTQLEHVILQLRTQLSFLGIFLPQE